MDFSTRDAKPAITRGAAAAAAAVNGASTLLRGLREFGRSGAPARFLCFEGGRWVDVAAEAVPRLRRAFLERRAMADAACGGRAYLFDFPRMRRIDGGTGEEAALAWIDQDGGCFFPAPAAGVGTNNKRKRDDDHGVPAAEVEVDESSSSSSGVDERSGESPSPSLPGVEVDANKRRKGAWGNGNKNTASAAARLEEADKYYQVVSKLFLSYGMARRGAAVTAVRKVVHGARAAAFHEQGRLLAAYRGAAAAGTAKFAWYGASADEVAALVDQGFVRNNAARLGARRHGDGVHLSPPQCPYTSAMLAKADGSGEAHIVLCRVLMGRPEAVPAGSSQSCPSSHSFDSAVDKLENPQWYVVWNKDMNTRIHPEYVVSFKCPKVQQIQESSEATSKLKKRSPVVRDMFPALLAEIEHIVPDKCDLLQKSYNNFKMGQIKKDQFIRFLRNYVGDKVLTTVAKKLRGC